VELAGFSKTQVLMKCRESVSYICFFINQIVFIL
jgi:hypothetical protein